MELFDVIDSKGNPAGQIVSKGKKPMQKEFPQNSSHMDYSEKKRAEYRFFYRNAHKNKDSFPGKI